MEYVEYMEKGLSLSIYIYRIYGIYGKIVWYYERIMESIVKVLYYMGYHSITIIIVGYCHVLCIYIYKYICEIKILIYLKIYIYIEGK